MKICKLIEPFKPDPVSKGVEEVARVEGNPVWWGVVVEEGKDHVGSEVRVIVTSALQTSAGRMIFAKPPSVLAS